jgi:3-mercaptopyruvate sulfurtransferase SseA
MRALERLEEALSAVEARCVPDHRNVRPSDRNGHIPGAVASQ